MEDLLFLKKKNLKLSSEIQISGSKSESNRLLIINSLYSNSIKIQNLSDAEDTRLLQEALKQNSGIVNIHHAGTAMRFLTAYYATLQGSDLILTGSERMKQRPIGVLVEALKTLGAYIHYIDKEGFPPLEIKGKEIIKDTIELEADVSSQFISALMLIAPKLKRGLNISLKGKITSQPYIEMTLKILNKLGIHTVQIGNSIRIEPKSEIQKQNWIIESDYSSASYFYSMITLSKNSAITIGNFKKESLQGDSKVVEIYKNYFGVETKFKGEKIILTKIPNFIPKSFELDLNDTPDLAQTIAVTATGLKIKCKLTGLQTLKIKEADRLSALHNELKKVGANSVVTTDSIELVGFSETTKTPLIQSYNDHRMAMSFAALSLIQDLKIQNPKVVEKSYPNFWNDLNEVLV